MTNDEIKTPADALLDTAEWTACPHSERGPDGIPVVTHEGRLSIAGMQLDCVQLDDGRRLITQESMMAFLDALESMEYAEPSNTDEP